jgi:hypothetical protein
LGAISGTTTAPLLFTLSADCEDSARFFRFGRVNKSRNWSSGDKETVIIGWAGRGVVDRFFVPAEEPDSKDADRVLGGLSPEDGGGGSAGVDEVCVVEVCFDDREWEKWAANFELRDGVGTLLDVGSGGTGAWTTEGTEGRLSRNNISTSDSKGDDRKREANCPQKKIQATLMHRTVSK